MYHLRLKGNHYDIGVKRGKIFNKCGIVFPLNLDEYQMDHGIKSEKILKEVFPEVCEEIKGITDETNIDYKKFASWLLAMGCCMYNLENNVPLEVRGCTAFAVVYKDKVYYGRNNDLPPFLKQSSKSEIYTLKDNRFNITTSSFINGEEGMNKYGLVVAMTFVGTKLEDIKPGLNSVFIVRYLLEKARTTKEACELLNNIKVASNCNILLADSSKEICVIECTPQKKYRRESIAINKDLRVICTVNNFVSDDMKKYEWDEDDIYNTYERYNNVIEAFKNYKKENMVDYIIDILKGNKGFMCQYDKSLNFETIWSSVFDITTLSILRAEGHPRKTKYIVDNRLNQ